MKSKIPGIYEQRLFIPSLLHRDVDEDVAGQELTGPSFTACRVVQSQVSTLDMRHRTAKIQPSSTITMRHKTPRLISPHSTQTHTMHIPSSLHLILALLLLSPPALTTSPSSSPKLPLVINTWGGPFTKATDAAYLSLLLNSSSSSVLDAVQAGCATCERNQCDGSVGFGGSPDEACETTLDALIMDGQTLNVGAVAGLRRVRDAIAVARHVLDHTAHSMLVGDQATDFAIQNGFTADNLTTDASAAQCRAWQKNNCQPNFRLDVSPAASSSCGPYKPLLLPSPDAPVPPPHTSHDTISLIAISSSGAMAAGTSTNGARHKIPGRVGDGPIAGSGSYVDGEAGGCGATGDGDVMMRFLPCYQAVESMRRGATPAEAADDAVRRMARRYPGIMAGLVVVDKEGRHAGAASGWAFTYSFRAGVMEETEVVNVEPLDGFVRDEL